MNLNPFNNKIGLALGGGAAKGVAHIGVLKSLDKANIEVSYISGTSAGAIVASYFAFGKKIENYDELANILRAKSVINLSIGKLGLMNTDRLEKYLKESLGEVNIEDARIPLAICATNINTGEETYFRSGPLIPALSASSALPGLVRPVQIDDNYYVDGGISNNAPIKILKEMGAGVTIAVDLNGFKRYPKVDSIFDVITNSMDIAIDLRTKDHLKLADIAINLDLSKFSRLDNLDNFEEVIQVGVKGTEAKLLEIKRSQVIHFLYFLKDFIFEVIPFRFKLPFSKK